MSISRSLLSSALALAVFTVPIAAQAPNTPAASAGSNTWRIDASHSELSFRIRHFVSKVRGTFGSWHGTITADPAELGSGSVQVVIDANSIDTNNERRDSDLKSDDFFDAANHPQITFTSRSVQVNGSDLTIEGDLTMRGITKPVTLTGSYIGTTTDNRGRKRIGFEVGATINRLDWGITWNRLAEGGGAMLGDDVEIEIVVAAVQQ